MVVHLHCTYITSYSIPLGPFPARLLMFSVASYSAPPMFFNAAREKLATLKNTGRAGYEASSAHNIAKLGIGLLHLYLDGDHF